MRLQSNSSTWFSSRTLGAARDLATDMDNMVTFAQMQMRLPRDPGMEERLLARLADPHAPSEERFMVLNQLLFGSEQRIGMMSNGLPPASDAFIRVATDFAASQSDPRKRAGTWQRVREITSPGVVAPVIAALGKETDPEVRLTLISILARNFSAEPQARETLQSIARTEPRELARMAAVRALSGDASWNEYVLAKLRNTQLTDAQRIEPLTYLDSSGRYTGEQPPLNEEDVRILGSLLERAETYPSEIGNAMNVLQNANSQASREEMYRLLAVREGRQVLFDVRNSLLSRRVAQNPLDDSTRALAEDIATRDPDPRIRLTARMAIDAADKRQRAMASPLQRRQ